MSRAAIALLAALTLTACIKRYAAPEEAADSQMPYSAVAAMQRLVLPGAEEVPGPALPEAALRLAIGSEGWFLDDALRGGALLAEGDDLDAAWGLLGETAGEVVVLLDHRLVREPAVCELLRALGDRAVLAAGTPGYGIGKAEPREPAEGLSRDPLGRVSVSCP